MGWEFSNKAGKLTYRELQLDNRVKIKFGKLGERKRFSRLVFMREYNFKRITGNIAFALPT